jgi:hypothetical protein
MISGRLYNQNTGVVALAAEVAQQSAADHGGVAG